MKLITENNWLVSIIDIYDIEFVVKVTIPDDNEDLKRVQEIDPSVKRDIYIYCNKDLNLKDFEYKIRRYDDFNTESFVEKFGACSPSLISTK